MYKLKLSAQAKAESKLVRKSYHHFINKALLEIKQDPLYGYPLSDELTGRFSFKVGVYRIVYLVNKQNKTVTIISIGHRSTVYN